MRLRNFAKLDYLNNRRLNILKSANTPLQRRLQIINNQAIDRKVLELSGEPLTDEVIPAYSETKLVGGVMAANKLASDKMIRQMLRKSIATDNQINRVIAFNASQKVNNKLTSIEVERIGKNLRYVEATLKEAEIEINTYKNLIEKLPSTISRQDVLEKALVKGSNYKGREYSYKELNQLSRDLEKYKTNAFEYETARLENIQADSEGYDRVNTTKTWIWSQLEKTRHSQMDGETIDFASKFEVVNEVTGDTDMLRFPGDVENDHNNCSNICNCQCSYIIN